MILHDEKNHASNQEQKMQNLNALFLPIMLLIIISFDIKFGAIPFGWSNLSQ